MSNKRKDFQFCLLCSSKTFEEEIGNNDYQVLKCKQCGFIQTKLLNTKFGITKELNSSPSQAKKHFENQKEEFLQFAKNILDSVLTKQGKLLDVGCGFGWVVAEADKRGYDAIGIDPSKVYVALGKKTLGVNLLSKSLQKFRTKERFNVIVLNHVLEHIKDPVNFLEKVRSLLVPGGEVFIACPNIRSLMFLIFREKWYGLQPTQHFAQFTPDYICKVIKKAGFTVRDVSTGSLYYNPTSVLRKLAFVFLTNIGEAFGFGDQVFVNAIKTI